MLATTRTASRPSNLDPEAVVASVLPLFHSIAVKVRRSLRFDGPGHAEAEKEELVNEAVVALLEALRAGRFDPAKAKLTTYAYKLADRVMRQYARACHYGLSGREYHRQCARKETPAWHRSAVALEGVARRQDGDPSDRESSRRVDAVLSRLPSAERRLLQAYLEENGNRAAVERRYRKDCGKWLARAFTLALEVAS